MSSLITTREQRRQLARDNAKQPAVLMQVPRNEWPDPNSRQIAVWRSRDFLVQLFEDAQHEGSGPKRLSVNRTHMAGDRWADGITWDELQRVKREVGMGHLWAVEVYPPDHEVVNVANVRHLWLVPAPAFAWRKGA